MGKTLLPARQALKIRNFRGKFSNKKKRKIRLNFEPFPDPPTLRFFGKSKEPPPHKKTRVFPDCRIPKILGKERKTHTKKKGKSESENSKEIEKSKDWKVRAFFSFRKLCSAEGAALPFRAFSCLTDSQRKTQRVLRVIPTLASQHRKSLATIYHNGQSQCWGLTRVSDRIKLAQAREEVEPELA